MDKRADNLKDCHSERSEESLFGNRLLNESTSSCVQDDHFRNYEIDITMDYIASKKQEGSETCIKNWH